MVDAAILVLHDTGVVALIRRHHGVHYDAPGGITDLSGNMPKGSTAGLEEEAVLVPRGAYPPIRARRTQPGCTVTPAYLYSARRHQADGCEDPESLSTKAKAIVICTNVPFALSQIYWELPQPCTPVHPVLVPEQLPAMSPALPALDISFQSPSPPAPSPAKPVLSVPLYLAGAVPTDICHLIRQNSVWAGYCLMRHRALHTASVG